MTRALLVLLCLVPLRVMADEPVRVLISIGNDVGDPDDVPLRFAETDAERFVQLMVDIGQVQPERAFLAAGLDAHQVREKLAEVKGRLAELQAAGKQTLLFLYVSSHAQAGALHLKGTHLPLAELREFADSTGAQLRLVVVDACDSGLVRRDKGVKPGKDFDITVQAAATKGQVLISSSGPAEASQEWDLFQGSLFTHHLLTGLRGDADQDHDGQVTLTEAYAYTWRRTVAQAAGGQHPTFDFDLTGSIDVTLSKPKSSRAAVVFPTSASGHFVVVSQPRPDVVAEVQKVEGQPLRLAVPPGRYVVRQLLGAKVGLADFELPFGGEYHVEPAQLQVRHFAEVASKGGYVQVRPSQIALGAAVESAQLVNAGPRVRLELQARRSFESWLVGVGVGAAYWSFRGDGLTTREWSFEPWLEAGWRFLSFTWTPTIGIRAGADVRRQSYVRDEEKFLQTTLGAAPLPERWSAGALIGPFIGAEVSVSERWLIGARASVQARWLLADGQLPWTAVVQGNAYAGVRF